MSRSRLWMLPVLLAVLVAGGWYFGFRAKENDRELPVYVTGAERMLAGEEIYRRGADAKPFTYPPFGAVPFVPMVPVPANWRAPVWFAVNFAILIVLARWLHGWARRGPPGERPPRMVLFWVGTLLLGGHHIASVLSNQSHDLIIALLAWLAAWGCCRGGRWGWLVSGLAAGCGAAIKATPLLFLELFALRRRWLAIVGLVVAAVGLSLLPDLLFPRGDGRSWIVAWYEINLSGLQVGGTASAEGAWNAHSYLNQSLSGALVRLFTPVVTTGAFVDEGVMITALSPGVFKVLSLLLQLGVVGTIALGVLAIARIEAGAADPVQERRTYGLAEVALIVGGMVLLSPQSSKSHFCVWIFAAAFLTDRLIKNPRDLVLWSLVVLSFLLGPMASKGIVGRDLGNKLLAIGNVTWSTWFSLLAVVRVCRVQARAHLGAAR
ncbi:MAG: DUF2029 domain-containing protein [Planctomycetes bacterium]|nr:DUF2029 domain-containing protein [Planctomycetota bacterium]